MYARLAPFAAFAVLFALFALLLPERTYGDDLFFVWCIVRDRVFQTHFLFMPLARGWTWVAANGGIDPLTALRLLSAAGTAAGGVLLFVAARRRGASLAAALFLAALVLTAASTWFFAVAGEIHGTHLAAVGLLALVLAGLRAESSPWRVLGAALAFGAVVGSHQSGGLLLPGVLAVYAVSTGGRAKDRRVRDLGAFALGGAISLGAMYAARYLAAGGVATQADPGASWAVAWRQQLAEGYGPGEFLTYAAGEWITPAFAPVLLGMTATGSLLRLRPSAAFAVLAVTLPYVVFFALWDYTERGAYYIVTLPAALGAVLLAWRLGDPPRGTAQRVFTSIVFLVALAGAAFPYESLLERLGTFGAVALVAAGFAGGVALPHHAFAGAGKTAAAGALLVAAQLAGAQRTLAAYDSGTPRLDWGRDACVATGGEDSVLVLTGFQEFMLMLLLNRSWPEPYADTWAYRNEIGVGPLVVDVGLNAPKVPDGAQDYLEAGTRVFVRERVFFHFENDPLRGEHVRALRERFDLTPANHGSFEGFELHLKEDG